MILPDLEVQSLYLRKEINRGNGQWAIIGEKLRFYLDNLYSDSPIRTMWKNALDLEILMKFHELEGKARGEVIKKLMLIDLTQQTAYPVENYLDREMISGLSGNVVA